MKKVLDFIAKVCELLVISLGIALILIVLLQIFGRVLGNAVSWTEELSRYILAGIVAFAAPLAARRGLYIRVDILLNRFPRKAQKIWQKSSVLRIPMSWLYMTVLIGPALTALFFLEKAVNGFREVLRGKT